LRAGLPAGTAPRRRPRPAGGGLPLPRPRAPARLRRQCRPPASGGPDGSLRLAREIPYGSPAWQARYGRRNLAESRNGQVEGLGLKRMAAYGLTRNQKEVQVGDFVLNLRTLGRLVRQATQRALT